MRADLLALSPQALAQLANMGLVKRAQREIAEGQGPSLTEDADGTVTGIFPDKVVAKLPPSTPLKEAPCSCGAPTVCRHRIAVALAYGPWHESRAVDEPTGAAPSDEGPAERSERSWSPGAITDATLEAVLGAKILERARRNLARGLVASVARADVPIARLPSCTVRFLVPDDVAYARCDCVDAGGACEHLALAVWAFRAADGKDASSMDLARERGPKVVALGGAATVSPGCRDALADAVALARELLARGLETFSPAPARFAHVKKLLAQEGAVWVHDLVSDLELAIEGYHARSALYGAREIAALLVELAMRARAGVGAGDLPPQFVLGQGEASETKLDHVRLVSLGARLRADGKARYADVFLADPDTATVLVLRKRWDYDEDAVPDDGPALARKRVAGGVSLHALAHGQVVSKSVRRLANRTIELATGPSAQSSVTPFTGDASELPSPLLVRDLAAHRVHERSLPPRELRPRVLAEAMHVVEIARVVDVGYVPSEQRVVARVLDPAGTSLRIGLGYRSVSPHALDATIAALRGGPRFVSGELSLGPGGFELVPTALAGERFVVPDLADRTDAPAVPHAPSGGEEGDLEAAVGRAEAVLEELCSVGLGAASRGLVERARAAGRALVDHGLVGLGGRMDALGEGGRGREVAWLEAGVRARLTRVALSE